MTSIILDGLFGNMLVLVLGAVTMLMISQAIGAQPGRTLAIYIWHTLFALLYIRVLQDMSGDATGYYQRAIIREFEWRPGSGVVRSITAFLAHELSLSFTAISLAFGVAGAIGLLLIDCAFRWRAASKSRGIRFIAACLVFLPSLSFWTAALGKDSIAMLATGLFLFGAVCSRRPALPFALAIVVMFLVRPHIAALMLAAIACGSLTGSSWNLPGRVALGALAMVAAVAVAPFILAYIGLEDGASQAAIEDLVAQRQSVNLSGGSSIDIATMNPAARLFAYLFRPLPFETTSLFGAVTGAENLILFTILISGFWFLVTGRGVSSQPLHGVMLVVYSGSALLILSQTTANLGIATRQKWMFLPMLMVIAIHYAPAVAHRVQLARR